MSAQHDLVQPQLGVAIAETVVNDVIYEIMVLEINTGSTSYTATIAQADNYKEVADKLREGIMRAGATMKPPRKKLITSVRELPDGLRKKRT